MIHSAKWIWLDKKEYGDYQRSPISLFDPYTSDCKFAVTEFKKEVEFEKKIKEIKYPGDLPVRNRLSGCVQWDQPVGILQDIPVVIALVADRVVGGTEAVRPIERVNTELVGIDRRQAVRIAARDQTSIGHKRDRRLSQRL